ncbi:MAG: hypothetical protein LUD16_06680 [Lachnospiraceae bacterium]|nr:hypothetical protein [Lachnospiraceae bacterium]MCD8347626.1 hypothetical protein [Lachnospiraceae bacterium]
MYRKVKRILAIVALVIICLLYLCTFILAFFQGERAKELLMLSLVATVVIPVLMYIYLWLFRLFRGDDSDDDSDK